MSLVDEVSEQLFLAFKEVAPPPSQRKAQQKKVGTDQVMRSLGKWHEMARSLRRAHRLGILARARVAFQLQRLLSTAGYPADLSRKVVFSLIVSAFVRSD
jgi:hypothetical protein